MVFIGFRYETDFQPAIYWTQDGGKTWEPFDIKLPAEFDDYSKTPMSPVFWGAKGLWPISIRQDDDISTIYVTSDDYGRTWTYDPSQPEVSHVTYDRNEAILMAIKDHPGFPASTSGKTTWKLPIGGPKGSTADVTFATSAQKTEDQIYIVTLTKDWGLTVNGTYVKSYWKYQVTPDSVTLIDSVDNDELPNLMK